MGSLSVRQQPHRTPATREKNETHQFDNFKIKLYSLSNIEPSTLHSSTFSTNLAIDKFICILFNKHHNFRIKKVDG